MIPHISDFATFLTITKTWKQNKYTLTDEKIQYIYTVEYYSVI